MPKELDGLIGSALLYLLAFAFGSALLLLGVAFLTLAGRILLNGGWM